MTGAKIQKLTNRKTSGGVPVYSYRICYPEWENDEKRNAFYRQIAEKCRDFAEKEAEKKEKEWRDLPRDRRRSFIPGSFLLLCEASEERETVRVRLTAVWGGGLSRRVMEQNWSGADEWMILPAKSKNRKK